MTSVISDEISRGSSGLATDQRINFHVWIDCDRFKCATQADNGERDNGKFLSADTVKKINCGVGKRPETIAEYLVDSRAYI